ncbi:patatin-like protein 3 [Phalaenopsis equestris]|uniref:patatin-like protein 3 n=1 Tax=Phalaenopsis equestris TaxID=78828 RepID=UPI0009E65AF9|nr:patatin-like protein 3 [Phalaenopsis equestris]
MLQGREPTAGVCPKVQSAADMSAESSGGRREFHRQEWLQEKVPVVGKPSLDRSYCRENPMQLPKCREVSGFDGCLEKARLETQLPLMFGQGKKILQEKWWRHRWCLLTINLVSKNIFKQLQEESPVKPVEYNKFLVLSLGTGAAKFEVKYDAKNAAKWGILPWLFYNGHAPIIDIYSRGSADMTDILTSILFQTQHSEKNYVRLKDDALSGDLASVDVSTKENLEGLIKVGNNLLKKPVSSIWI